MPHFLLSVLVLASLPLAAQDSAPEATMPVQAAPMEDARRLASLYEGTLLGVVDGQDFGETPGYRRLLEIVSSYGENELRNKAPKNFVRTDALAHPDAWRGELVRVRGLLAGEGMKAERLAYPIGEHTDVYRALVTEPDGSDGVFLDFLHPPPSFTLGRDMVEAEAVFVRLVGYENRKGEHVEAPYLIARDLRELDTTDLHHRTAFDEFGLILLGAVLAYMVIRIVLSMRSKKGRAKHDPERAARLIRERARAALPARPRANKP